MGPPLIRGWVLKGGWVLARPHIPPGESLSESMLPAPGGDRLPEGWWRAEFLGSVFPLQQLHLPPLPSQTAPFSLVQQRQVVSWGKLEQAKKISKIISVQVNALLRYGGLVPRVIAWPKGGPPPPPTTYPPPGGQPEAFFQQSEFCGSHTL